MRFVNLIHPCLHPLALQLRLRVAVRVSPPTKAKLERTRGKFFLVPSSPLPAAFPGRPLWLGFPCRGRCLQTLLFLELTKHSQTTGQRKHTSMELSRNENGMRRGE